MRHWFGKLFGHAQPINRLLMFCFVLIALVPVSFLGVKLYHAAWDNAWREIYEKHRLLALNLASPISTYVDDHRAMLAMLAFLLHDNRAGHADAVLLDETLKKMKGFQSLVLMDGDGNARLMVPADAARAQNERRAFSDEHCYLETLLSQRPQISNVKYSPLSGQPTIILSQPVYGPGHRLTGVLLGELGIDYIEQLRRTIHFGKRGHSAIVDHTGHVIAHPNPAWMQEIRDISSLPIVQRMMAGQTGVTEFYSPFVKAQMVAGYTSVPGIGWGIMVPQPKSEVEEQVHRLLYAQLSWAAGGLLLAVLCAVVLARWITRPLNRLAAGANHLVANAYQGSIPATAQRAPREVQQLRHAFGELIDGLQASREEVSALNRSLQQRVDEATRQLRESNSQLEVALARTDEFMSFARHDLRKPVAVITDIATCLQQGLAQNQPPPPDLGDTLGLITKSAEYMKSIIDDFFGKLAIQDGLISVATQSTQLNQLIELTVKSNERYADRKGIRLSTELAAELTAVDGDEVRLAQVLHNLVDNALKFSARGDAVRVRSYNDGPYAVVEVRDSGPGLTPEDLEKVFTKHAQLSNRPTGGEASTGLGLAICLHIVELHGGEIGVRNNAERGCTFWFRLPRR